MKALNENLIAAYIDGGLSQTERTEIEKYLTQDKEFYNTVKDVISAKRVMNSGEEKELPWQLKEFIEQELHTPKENPIRLILRVLKNGLSEIQSTLTGRCEALSYTVRGAVAEAPAFKYTHHFENLHLDLLTYYEDSEHIRIKLFTTDTDDYPVNGKVKVMFNGKLMNTKTGQNGIVEFDNLKKGLFDFIIEFTDTLSENPKPYQYSFALKLV